MTKIEHYINSFISVISDDNKVLWCDPWLSGANGGLWAPSEISIKNFLDIYDLPNLLAILIVVLVSFRVGLIPLWLSFFLCLFAFTPFFLNEVLFFNICI